MTDERRLSNRLRESGFTTACSKRGRLLRVDSRTLSRPVESLEMEQVCLCGAMRELYLPDLDLSINAFVGRISEMAGLRVLDVEGSDFSDESLEQLADLQQLQVLNVRNTQVSSDCVAQLRKRMIGTRIII